MAAESSVVEGVKLVKLVEDGDVIIQVEGRKGICSFQLSSQILCLTSEYFRNMFKLDFQEGQALANTESTPTITLKEDNYKSMELIFRVIHHKMSTTPEEMTLDALEELVVHCDKYMVGRVMAITVAIQLASLQRPVSNPKARSAFSLRAIHIAAQIGDKAILDVAALNMLKHFFGNLADIELQSIAKPIIEETELKRKQHFDDFSGLLQQGIQRLIKDDISVCSDMRKLECCNKPLLNSSLSGCPLCNKPIDMVSSTFSCNSDSRTMTYMRHLSNEELIPSHKLHHQLSLKEYSKKILKVCKCIRHQHCCAGANHCSLIKIAVSIKDHVSKVIEDVNATKFDVLDDVLEYVKAPYKKRRIG